MKIYSDWVLEDHPKAKKVTEWIPAEEECTEYVYHRYRLPQNQEPDGWFRNLKLLRVEKFTYANLSYDVYHISYEREHTYYVVDIDDNFDALLELLKPLNSSYGLINKNDELWIELIGE